ncbi:GyrI-like domain-containing protein [Paenilisteria rocourtiae]|uniref:Putative transcriptional regulator YdeE n=1 Tax=Listeria rocourtiae TaxID=647910 RepID=A0A4R6ZQ56_9LIST|nr:effector binding domain-containing protein [Listeria rocourtiae]EUJ43222.1 transcription activator [Listeria rocourtiae FSL F6-920]MBC1435793.1 hypothetical protein [Listeria rocourtiae]MBC1604115.1 hypothetical protein [Listeria rocourtiae]TDR54618.1 putative transcriptional regulator YdeE [Listeria rocourtiae]
MALSAARFEEHEGFTALAFVWKGTFEEAFHGEVHKTIKRIQSWAESQESLKHDKTLLGMSVHNLEDGFTYYSAVKANWKPENVPDDMEWIEIPAHTYFVCDHVAGTDINETYKEVAERIAARDYRPYITVEYPVFDELPFKIEVYDSEIDLPRNQQGFHIMIPIVKHLG